MAKQKPKQKEEKIEKPKKEGMIEVERSQFENILKRMETLEKDKEMFLSIADKKQLSIYYQRHKDKIPSRVMLRTIMTKQNPNVKDSPLMEKVILGWRTTKDIVQPDPTLPGRWIEDQRVELLLEDGTSSGEMYLAQFSRNYKQVEAEVRSKITDEVSGNVALKVVRLDNGREYTIGVAFVN